MTPQQLLDELRSTIEWEGDSKSFWDALYKRIDEVSPKYGSNARADALIEYEALAERIYDTTYGG